MNPFSYVPQKKGQLMKSVFGLVLTIFSMSVFAYYSPFDGVREEICPELREQKNADIAFCKADNAKAVLAAKKGAKVATPVKVSFYNAIDLGIIPDADSNDAFFYVNWLVDSTGKKVGYLTINGWFNTEMESRGRVDTRYNLKGQVVSIELKQL